MKAPPGERTDPRGKERTNSPTRRRRAVGRRNPMRGHRPARALPHAPPQRGTAARPCEERRVRTSRVRSTATRYAHFPPRPTRETRMSSPMPNGCAMLSTAFPSHTPPSKACRTRPQGYPPVCCGLSLFPRLPPAHVSIPPWSKAPSHSFSLHRRCGACKRWSCGVVRACLCGGSFLFLFLSSRTGDEHHAKEETPWRGRAASRMGHRFVHEW